MTWTAGADKTTGTLVTASSWNSYLGATGSLMETATAKVTTAGDIVYATGANALARLAAGSTSQVLVGGTTPSWTAVPLGALATVPACRAYNTANVGLTATTWSTVTFNSERYDNDTIHDTGSNTSRLTCKTAGVYSIFATIQTDETNGRYAAIRFLLNGTTSIAYDAKFHQHNTSDVNNLNSISTHYKLAVNDYVEVQIWVENSSLNAIASGNGSPEFGMAWMSAG